MSFLEGLGRLMSRFARMTYHVGIGIVCLTALGIILGTLSAWTPAWAQVSAFEDPSSSTAGSAVGGQEFAPVKPEIEGGDIPVGQLAQVIVMMRNNTSIPITLQKIDLVPSSNVTATLVANQCEKEAVKPGIECPLTVSVKAEAPGKYRVGILANHTGRTKVTNLAITGTVNSGAGGEGGMPANEIEAFPAKVDFVQAKGRAPLVRSIALRNASTKPVTINEIELAASPLTGFSFSAPNCKILQPSAACVATVTWQPTTEGKSEGVIVLRHDGPSRVVQISVSGEYTPAKTEKAERFPSPVPGEGLIVADRETVEFGSEIDGAASITVSLVNAGDKAVMLRQVRLAGSDNGLSLSTDDCASGKVLEANQGCALTVNWLPRRKGPVIDDIQIIHNGARGVLVLPVRGTAQGVVNLNMPILGGSSVPKLPTGQLDEKLLGDAGKAAPGKKKNITAGDFALATDPSALNGFRVTSLSVNRAVITGPRGRIVVLDGQPQVIAGGHWIPRVMAEGVELIGERDSVVLFFDRSLGPISATSSMPSFATSGSSSSAPSAASSESSGAPTTP